MLMPRANVPQNMRLDLRARDLFTNIDLKQQLNAQAWRAKEAAERVSKGAIVRLQQLPNVVARRQEEAKECLECVDVACVRSSSEARVRTCKHNR